LFIKFISANVKVFVWNEDIFSGKKDVQYYCVPKNANKEAFG